jgi:hypothetical protein
MKCPLPDVPAQQWFQVVRERKEFEVEKEIGKGWKQH